MPIDRLTKRKAQPLKVWADEWLGMIAAMSPAAAGAWLRLALTAWKQGPPCHLPDDDRRLRRVAQVPAGSWAKLRGEVLEGGGWCRADGGGWIHPYLASQLEQEARRSEQAQAAAGERWNRRANGGLARADTGRNGERNPLNGKSRGHAPAMRGQCSRGAIQVSEIINIGGGGGSGATVLPDLAFYRAAFQQQGHCAEEAERLAAEAAASVSGTD